MLNLPNSITLFRLIMVLVFTVALAMGGLSPADIPAIDHLPQGGWFDYISGASAIALWAFVLGAVSDFLDGFIARRCNLITNLGKLIDPLADKILVCAAFVYLSSVGMCPFWVTVLILFREFLVTGLRQLAALQGQAMAADTGGKWKTGLQLGFCIACLFHLAYGGNAPQPLRYLSIGEGGVYCRAFFLWGSLVLTLWSGAHYCAQAPKLLRD